MECLLVTDVTICTLVLPFGWQDTVGPLLGSSDNLLLNPFGVSAELGSSLGGDVVESVAVFSPSCTWFELNEPLSCSSRKLARFCKQQSSGNTRESLSRSLPEIILLLFTHTGIGRVPLILYKIFIERICLSISLFPIIVLYLCQTRLYLYITNQDIKDSCMDISTNQTQLTILHMQPQFYFPPQHLWIGLPLKRKFSICSVVTKWLQSLMFYLPRRLCHQRIHVLTGVCWNALFHNLRNRKHFPCFHTVIETLVEVLGDREIKVENVCTKDHMKWRLHEVS